MARKEEVRSQMERPLVVDCAMDTHTDGPVLGLWPSCACEVCGAEGSFWAHGMCGWDVCSDAGTQRPFIQSQIQSHCFLTVKLIQTYFRKFG